MFQWCTGVNLYCCRPSQQWLDRLQETERLRYLVGFLAIQVVRSGGQSLNKHMGGCAEKHDVVELRIELHLTSRRAANEQHVSVVRR